MSGRLRPPSASSQPLSAASTRTSLVARERAIKARLEEIAKALSNTVVMFFDPDTRRRLEEERIELLNESYIISGQIEAQARTDLRGRTAPARSERQSELFGTKLNPLDRNQLITNVGLVTEAYFSPLPSFQEAFNLRSNNRPTTLKSADDLWRTSVANKGLIQSFVPRENVNSIEFNRFLPDDVKGNVQRRWGFRFHYNPGSVDMTYAGIPDIDVAYVASGQDPFNLVGSQVSQSTISFQLVLNRVFDMQYYDSRGRLRNDAPPSVYSPAKPSVEDQELIYNRGTMYDVEFLLSSILSFRANTQLRGNTADLGWIGGHPVELYLGKSLKYLAMTQGASLRHIIFNERMVPTFSTLSLTFNRIPDYASSGGDTTSGRGVTTDTPAAPPPPTADGGGRRLGTPGPNRPV